MGCAFCGGIWPAKGHWNGHIMKTILLPMSGYEGQAQLVVTSSSFQTSCTLEAFFIGFTFGNVVSMLVLMQIDN